MWSRWHCVLLPVLSAAGSDHTHQPNLLPCWFMIQNICRKWLSWDKLPLHKPLIAIPERWMYFLARSADLAAVTNRGIVSHSFIPPSVFEQCLNSVWVRFLNTYLRSGSKDWGGGRQRSKGYTNTIKVNCRWKVWRQRKPAFSTQTLQWLGSITLCC